MAIFGISKRKFVKMEASEIGRLKLKEARPLLRKMREEYKKQASIFGKYENTVFSPALDKMEDYYSENPMDKNISKMRLQKIQSELFRLQDFFQAKTSTVSGSRKVMREQDARIFGINALTGLPKKRLTLDQRTDFWAAYNEFVNMEKSGYVRNMGSNTIQRVLAGMVIEKGKKEPFSFSYNDFKELKRRLEEDKEKSEWEKSNYESFASRVLSGKRNNK